ncbi:hypothetical protein F5888DRAFT_533135 [Russula emetica]|nr:hypothetical protein F5888DRAFT_533135 [Russula emetica]
MVQMGAYLLIPNGRYRELCSWMEFKKTWRNLEAREITMPINDAYGPDTKNWICTCPFFVTSRFLICKHLVQRIHRPHPPTFFLQVKRYRSSPFWRHNSLKILDESGVSGERAGVAEAEGGDDDDGRSDGGDDDFDEDDGLGFNDRRWSNLRGGIQQ